MSVWLSLLAVTSSACAQELDPRRWAHLPVDANFLGGGYGYTEGDIALDPVLQVEDAQFEMNTFALKYIRTFELFDRPARAEAALGYQDGRWSGLREGVPTSISRSGMTDSVVRFAVNLYGAPVLRGRDYAAYRRSVETETIVGAALAVHLPTGEYLKDKLINLGSNRYTFRPQVGVVHTRGQWTGEVTTAAWIYTDNDSFFNGNRLEQDPYFTLQGHLIYNFRPGLWLGASAGYGVGAQSTINGEDKNDRRENVAWALSFGYPVSRRLGFKLSYVGVRAESDVGTDSDTLFGGVTTFW